MTKFTRTLHILIWILVILIGFFTVLAPSLFILRQVSNWDIGTGWEIGYGWDIGSTSVATPLPVDGITEFLEKTFDFLSQGEVAIPILVLGSVILSQIYKRRETLLRFQ